MSRICAAGGAKPDLASLGLVRGLSQPRVWDRPHSSLLELFEKPHEKRGIGTLMESVSKRYGRGSIGLGITGVRGGPDWSMKRDMLSPRYTTHLDELVLVCQSIMNERISRTETIDHLFENTDTAPDHDDLSSPEPW